MSFGGGRGEAARTRGRSRGASPRRGNDSQALRHGRQPRAPRSRGLASRPRSRNNDVNRVSLRNPVYLIEKSWVTLLTYFTQIGTEIYG